MAFRKVASTVFPWPLKHEREAALRAARQEKEWSQAAAHRAGTIDRQLRQMAADDQFAARIAEQIIRDV